MKTAVMTDTNSGIMKQEAEKLGIFLMHMPVIIDGKTCYEGIDLTQEELFGKLAEGSDVSTSQPSPGDVMDMWEKALGAGYDSVIYIPMTSGLSNSCETAEGLSAEYGDKVCVADNHRISVPMRQSIMEAKLLAEAGASAKEIKEKLEKEAYDCSIYIAVDTLEYLKKGGRVTAAGAALGTVLNIKPILSIQGEKLDAYAKVRGMKKCRARMIEALRNDLNTRFRDVDKACLQLCAAGTGLSKEEAKSWTQEISAAFDGADVWFDPLSLSIACHTGPGAMGIGVCVKMPGEKW